MSRPTTIDELGRVHIVGIGGAGLSGLARLMLDRGIAVSGSDTRDSSRITSLRQQGARITIGHDPENIRPDGVLVDTVVDTPIIPDSVADLVAARAAGVPVLSRAQALAVMLADSRVVGVGGTHGKTTTTSMITVALQHAGVDPSFAIGSEVNDLGSNAHTGSGEVFVVEADESDGAFLHMSPVAVVVTNVEPDHMDYWRDFPALQAGFLEFTGLVQANAGFAVVCIDQADGAELARQAKQAGTRVLTYGTAAAADYRIEIIGSTAAGYEFYVVHETDRFGPLSLQVPGVHNAANATAAFAVCAGLGVPAAAVIEGLAGFSGARRRFEFRGQSGGIRVYDDYAHHPTELTATLTAAREFVGSGRLVVAFQAHHYYRTAMFSKEFGAALGLADEVVVLEVFAPGEEPIPGASGQAMAANVPLPADAVVFEPSFSAVAGHLARRARPGDLIMTLGAGDISLLGTEVLAKLQETYSSAPDVPQSESEAP
ncbi:MAG: UDP-N-acetylmuramate--L-alanine ligase [Actinomycetia bacterium]|nr:UDP-N-acetylmuramate--L-alanine ligase [Actinomycetes bacterium]